MKSLAALLLFVLVFGACKGDDEAAPAPVAADINLRYLEPGQQSRYVLLRGENYLDAQNGNYEYLADTLVLEVISEDEVGFLVSERLTPGSASLNGAFHVAFAESTFFFYLIDDAETGQLRIQSTNERNRSRLFFTPDGDGLPMTQFEEPVVQMNGWKTDLPLVQSRIEARLNQYRFADQTFAAVNVLLDNRDMRAVGVGHTHLYAVDGPLLRSSRYSAQTGEGFGWDLLAR